MTEVSDWKTKDLENTAIDGLTLSAPQGNYWQKMMGAIKRMFGAVDERVTALEQGGGGGEEQFQKVYEVELEEALESDTLIISSTDMGGAYVDIILYLSLEGASAERTLEIDFGSSGTYSVATLVCPLSEGAETMRYMSFSVLSSGGLLENSSFVQNSDRTIGNGISGFLNNGIDFDYIQPYPSNDIPGVSSISLYLSSQAEVPLVFPAYTYIAVYARRKVIAAAGGE